MFWVTWSQRCRENNNIQVPVAIIIKFNIIVFMNRMITGDEVMTTGESFIDNVSLSSDKSTYLQSIGYCPQFDSIIEVIYQQLNFATSLSYPGLDR